MSADPSPPVTASVADASRLTAYLRERSPQATVATVRQIGGGASRETWLVDLEHATPALPAQLVIRKDTPFESVVPTSLAREYGVLAALAEHGVAVPMPYWFEGDAGRFGAKLYVRQGFDGTSDQRRFQGPAATRLARELGQALAHLHRIDARDVRIPERALPASIADAADEDLERWCAYRRGRAVEPAPLLEEIAWWLRRNRPAADGPPVVLWGDVGVANTVCSPDGGVLALSDWELAGYGDPMKDVAAGLWRGVHRLAGRDTFLDAYVEAGGWDVDDRRLHYYDVFINWQTAVFAHTAIWNPLAAGARNLHPPLLAVWAQRINLFKAARAIGMTP